MSDCTNAIIGMLLDKTEDGINSRLIVKIATKTVSWQTTLLRFSLQAASVSEDWAVLKGNKRYCYEQVMCNMPENHSLYYRKMTKSTASCGMQHSVLITTFGKILIYCWRAV